jgi:hypothetical protein
MVNFLVLIAGPMGLALILLAKRPVKNTASIPTAPVEYVKVVKKPQVPLGFQMMEPMVAAVEAAIEHNLTMRAIHRVTPERAKRLILEGFSAPKSRRRSYSQLLEAAIERVIGRPLDALYATPLPEGDLIAAIDAVKNKWYGEVAFVIRPQWAVGYEGDSLFSPDPSCVRRPSVLGVPYTSWGSMAQEEIITSSDSVTLLAVVAPEKCEEIAALCAARGIEYIAE